MKITTIYHIWYGCTDMLFSRYLMDEIVINQPQQWNTSKDKPSINPFNLKLWAFRDGRNDLQLLTFQQHENNILVYHCWQCLMGTTALIILHQHLNSNFIVWFKWSWTARFVFHSRNPNRLTLASNKPLENITILVKMCAVSLTDREYFPVMKAGYVHRKALCIASLVFSQISTTFCYLVFALCLIFWVFLQ